jgi:hypothetical protein
MAQKLRLVNTSKLPLDPDPQIGKMNKLSSVTLLLFS